MRLNEIVEFPVVAVRESVIFPHTDSILTFGRPKSKMALQASFKKDRVIAVFNQKNAKVSDPKFGELHPIGTLVTITQMISTEGDIHAMVRGQSRVRLREKVHLAPYLLAKVEVLNEQMQLTPEMRALSRKLVDLFKKAINLGKGVDVAAAMKLVAGEVSPLELVNAVSSLLEIDSESKQELLEIDSVKARTEKVIEHLTHEINVLDLEKTISSKTQKKFEDQMRKAMLREKKKTIEAELGEEGDDSTVDDIEEYRKKIKEAKMPKTVNKKAIKELGRLKRLSPHNPEGGYIRNYLDWLIDMPWRKLSPNNVSMKKAAGVLNKEHDGLDKAKERILEYLAVMKIKNEAKKKDKKSVSMPTILCFIGPPGVGKTSIGKSVAHAMGREFVRISLGGIRDEAEIRGHRRTYVGALPGRIIQGIKNAGTKNPIFMLDEIDKIGADYRGDPSSALLETLDPEQNREFSDHYLEVPFDLSEVFFIATGNMLDTIPPALRDRMEIISFPGYTEDEKYGIAKKFLWPKQLKAHGLESKKIKIDKVALQEIISSYTKEAGVRNLERNLAKLCRKIARAVAEGRRISKTVKKTDVRRHLGPQQYKSLLAERKNETGMATGLAVTAAGGEILFIEVSLMPGRGRLTLTGQLGDVMKESAMAAFTWSKSNWQKLGLKEDFSKGIDVHVHVPEGAVPKDGPSAGTSMSTALISALTGVAVKKEVGMTGEVTLRGRVLEIGGVKQKVIAAHRAGLKTLVLPKHNKKDMEDIPKNVKKDIKFVFAEHLEDVLKVALVKWPVARKSGSTQVSTRPTYLVN